jgi:hypothetical protein
MTAQDVANDVSRDMRGLIDPVDNGPVMLSWIDRIQKEILHSSLYSAQNISVHQITTASNQSSYNLASDTRRIRTVYHRSFDQLLIPLEGIVSPAAEMERSSPAIGAPPSPDSRQVSWQTWGPLPLYYQRVWPNLLFIYPAPKVGATTIEVTYEKAVPNLTSLSNVLTLIDDARDVIVAGVNMLASMYLKRNDEATYWASVYQKLIGGSALK